MVLHQTKSRASLSQPGPKSRNSLVTRLYHGVPVTRSTRCISRKPAKVPGKMERDDTYFRLSSPCWYLQSFPFLSQLRQCGVVPSHCIVVSMNYRVEREKRPTDPDFTFSTGDASRSDMLTRSLLRLLGLRLHGHHCGNTARSVTRGKVVGNTNKSKEWTLNSQSWTRPPQ